MKRILFLAYGVVCYGIFFGTYCYAVGFVTNLVVPTGLDSKPTTSFGLALLINLSQDQITSAISSFEVCLFNKRPIVIARPVNTITIKSTPSLNSSIRCSAGIL